MKHIEFLLAANIIVWAAIFGYIRTLMKKNNILQKDIDLLKEKMK